MDSGLARMADQLTVEFIEVPESYKFKEDIQCKYVCIGCKVQDGDRIAVFKLGWKSLKSYVIFEWASPVCVSKVHTTIFNKVDIPSCENELYQFCYIGSSNTVQGISTPFQVISDQKMSNLTDSLKHENQSQHLKHLLLVKDNEIERLKEENLMLRESLRAILQQNNAKNYDHDIFKLSAEIGALKIAFQSQQDEIHSLKKTSLVNQSPKKEAVVKRLDLDFDFGNLQSLPQFPLFDTRPTD